MKEKQIQRKRKIKVPIGYCRSMNELTSDKKISYIEFYEQTINGSTYIFDIICTTDKEFYVKVTSVTNGYEELEFNKFKTKYAQPSLFDFFNI